MSVTVGMLRKRLEGVDEKAPVNLVTGDQDLERMVRELGSACFLKITGFGSSSGDDNSSFYVAISLADMGPRTQDYDVWALSGALEDLPEDTTVYVRTNESERTERMLDGATLRINNAYKHATDQSAEEFTIEIALEE